jgi:hypothetical protein
MVHNRQLRLEEQARVAAIHRLCLKAKDRELLRQRLVL